MSDHYFSAEPGSDLVFAPVTATVWGHELELVSASGVFSRGRVDGGTAVLFRVAEPAPLAETVLDLGCGYGVIAAALATRLQTAQVWAVDVNERALRLTNRNAAAIDATHRIHAVQPDQVPAGIAFDEIWSNPPIRVGKVALHELLLTWLPRLKPTGRAVMVVGKNLGADSLQSWLRSQGFPTERLASAKGFRVLQVRRGPAG